MVDSHNSPNPLPPAELVGKRLDENRLFEARFLFQKFSSAIDPPARRKLVQQLATRISRAEKTFAEGELLEQAGDFEKAIRIFAKVHAMAIDYPSLAEAQKRVEIAIKLGPLQPVEPPEQRTPAQEPLPPVTRTEASDSPGTGLSFFQQQKVVLFLVSALLLTFGFVVLIFFRPAVQPVSESNTRINKLTVSAPNPNVINQKTSDNKEQKRETSPGNNSLDSALSPPENTASEQGLPVTPQEKASSEPTAPLPISGQLVEPTSGSTEEDKNGTPPVHESPQETDVFSQVAKTTVTNKTVLEQKHNFPSLQPEVPKAENREEPTQPADTNTAKQTTQNSSQVSELSGQPAVSSGKEISSLVSSNETSKTYTVQKGDTLETIADKMYGNRYKWSNLVSVNREKLGRPPYILTVGMQLQIPSLELLESKKTVALNDDGTYTVQSGDSLGSIALKLYGTSKKWKTLYELNRDQLPTPGGLQVGQKLLVDKNSSVTKKNNSVRE